jgi:hypothetical protein
MRAEGLNQTAKRIVQEPLVAVKHTERDFPRIISFNSIAYVIISPLYREEKNRPKAVFIRQRRNTFTSNVLQSQQSVGRRV